MNRLRFGLYTRLLAPAGGFGLAALLGYRLSLFWRKGFSSGPAAPLSRPDALKLRLLD